MGALWLAETTHEERSIAEVARGPRCVTGPIFSHELRSCTDLARAGPHPRAGTGWGLRPSQSEEDNPPNILFGSESDADAATRFRARTKRTVVHRLHIESYSPSYRWIRRTVSVDTCDSDD